MSIPSRRQYTIITIAYQYLGVALSIVIGIFLVPTYLRYISVPTYGLWLATGNVLMWIGLVDPGLAYVLQQQAAKAYGKKEMARVGAIIGTGVSMNLMLVALFLVVALVLGWQLSWLVTASDPTIEQDLFQAFMLAAFGGALNLLSFVFRCSNQALHAAVPVGGIDLTVKASGVLVVLLALRHGFGLKSFGILTLWSGILNSVGNGCCLWFLIRRHDIPIRVSTAVSRQLFGLMSFNFLGRLANIVQGFDLLVVNNLLGAEVAALFGLTRRVPDFVRSLIFIPVEAAGPSLSHLLGQGDKEKMREMVRRLASLSIWCTGLAAAGCLALNDEFVRRWVGGRLFAGSTINRLVCLQMGSFMLVSAFSSLCFYLGDVKYLNLVAFARSLILFGLIFVGARIGGLTGVAFGGLIAMLVLVWYPIWSTMRRANFDRSDRVALAREGLAVAAAACAAIGVARIVSYPGWFMFSAAAAALAGVYAGMLAACSPEFRATSREALRGVVQRLTLANVGA